MNKLNQFFVVLFLLALVFPIKAQLLLDPSFNPFIRSGADINSAVEQTDGKVIFASGNALLVNGQPRFLFRLNADGSFDNTFDVETDIEEVLTVDLQSNGQIIIGGSFKIVNGNVANYLARLNSDGSFDGSFNMGGTGPDAEVEEVIVDGSDRILMRGQFLTYNGTSAPYFTRLNSDGSLDGPFNTNLGTGPDFVNVMGLQSTGDIIVAGMSIFDGAGANGIVRLLNDGTRDAFF